jgi:hypothetical protein
MLFGIAGAPLAAQHQAGPAAQPVAILSVISGDVLMRTATGDFTSALDGAVLYVGTVLRTSADARALITLFEGSTVELDPASDVTIEDTRSGSTLAQSLARGLRVVMHLTTADTRYEPTTPVATASVRGIDFEIAVAAGLVAVPAALMPSAQLVAPTVAIPASVQVAARAETTTVRAITAAVSARSTSRGERVRKVLAQTLVPLAPSAGRSRSGDDDDRQEDDREKD